MLNYEDFKSFYKKYKRFPNNIYSNPNKLLNDTQLETKYKKYLISEEKKNIRFEKQVETQMNKQKEIIIDEKWEQVKLEVWKRDTNQCQYLKSLNVSDLYLAKKLLRENKHLTNLDCAHVLGKGSYPEIKYNIDNIILLTRLFHSRIDNYKHPLTGNDISKEERNNIWISIIGQKRFDLLLDIIKK